ncbi:MAG: heme o synthase [Acidobacteria bacterium]|nr:heme o synthase [Acidobacteriota bacterium]
MEASASPAGGAAGAAGERSVSWFSDLMELTRLRLNLMVVLTTAIGFAMAVTDSFPVLLFIHTVLGTTLVAAASSALNQVLERDIDAKMRRTQARPIPSGRLSPDAALAVGVGIALVGLVELTFAVNLLTALLGALTLAGYLFVYTPLKRKTSLATVIGAVPGAIPPVMGWTALRGEIGAGAWVLFTILFLWQLPHFLAIAWVYRADYARGGLPMLPVVDPEGELTARQMVLYCAALLPVSLLPTLVGLTGPAYFACAVVAGIAYLAYAFLFVSQRTNLAARRLMIASVLYLPALLTAMMLDRLLG